MACLEFNDGTKVYLSDETTNRLRKELCKPVKEQLIVDKFRAIQQCEDNGGWVKIAIMSNTNDGWDGYYDGNAKAVHLLSPSEVKKVVNGLLEMIGD